MHQIHDYLNQLADKEILIFGLGREGLSTYRLLRHYLPSKKLWLIDEKGLGSLEASWQELNERDTNVQFSTHLDHPELETAQQIIVFKTPGVAPHNKILQQASELKAYFTSNTDLFFSLVDIINANLATKHTANKKIVTVGITGTKGKSTTSALISHVLTTAGVHSFLGGNIGIAPLSLIEPLLETVQHNASQYPVFAVLELSCHQLHDITHSPNYAVVLDITPEHLDYYEDFNEYVQAKSHICMYQTQSDFAIFDSTLYLPKKIAHLSDAQQLTFSYDRNVRDNWITYETPQLGKTHEQTPTANQVNLTNQAEQTGQIVDLDSLPLIGAHTIANALPSVVIAKQLGITNNAIAQALQSFKTLPHRLELVQELAGVSYYNDSLSTTPVATIAAIKSFANAPIILIAGGFDRGLDYSELAQTIVDHQIKHLILLPDTGEIILEEVEKRLEHNRGELSYTRVASMSQAVRTAKQQAKPGDIVLMSPASASFNLFADYQDRGEQFRKFVADKDT